MRLYKYRIPDPLEICTCSGCRKEVIYSPHFNGSEIVLVKSGTFDIQDKINSFAPYTDLRYMLNQLKFGDTSVLSDRPPMYGDFSSMPLHPVDALNLVNDVERRFSTLSDEVKASCNNDWRVYFTRLFTSGSASDSGVSSDLPAADSGNSVSGGVDNAT